MASNILTREYLEIDWSNLKKFAEFWLSAAQIKKKINQFFGNIYNQFKAIFK